MENDKGKYELGRAVSAALADNPAWLPTILGAVSSGMNEAIERAFDVASKKDMGMMSALALSKGGRISDDLRGVFLSRIEEAISPVGASNLEKEFLRMSETHRSLTLKEDSHA